jgi:hypothetical protein
LGNEGSRGRIGVHVDDVAMCVREIPNRAKRDRSRREAKGRSMVSRRAHDGGYRDAREDTLRRECLEQIAFLIGFLVISECEWNSRQKQRGERDDDRLAQRCRRNAKARECERERDDAAILHENDREAAQKTEHAWRKVRGESDLRRELLTGDVPNESSCVCRVRVIPERHAGSETERERRIEFFAEDVRASRGDRAVRKQRQRNPDEARYADAKCRHTVRKQNEYDARRRPHRHRMCRECEPEERAGYDRVLAFSRMRIP